MSKNLHAVYPMASETSMVPQEPTWENLTYPSDLGEKYNSTFLNGMNWHYYVANEKNFMKYMEEWLREYRPATAKADIKSWRNFDSSKDPVERRMICTMARMQLQGFPLNSSHAQKIRDYVSNFLTAKPVPVKATSANKQPKPSVQDRMRAQISAVLAELDGCVDDAFDGTVTSCKDMQGVIFSRGQFKSPQLKMIASHIKAQITEWTMAYNKEDDQLVEGYSYVNRKLFKNIISEFTELVDSLSRHETSIKIQRIRKRKPMDKKKLASKIRFKAEHEGIKSCNPVDIIGANMVWVYDTKKRRLGYYEAEVKDSLYVKGPKIYGFKNTCEKILRKPEEQLAEVMKLRKNQTVNWFDGIKAKCKVLKGRTTADLLIVRID